MQALTHKPTALRRDNMRSDRRGPWLTTVYFNIRTRHIGKNEVLFARFLTSDVNFSMSCTQQLSRGKDACVFSAFSRCQNRSFCKGRCRFVEEQHVHVDRFVLQGRTSQLT